MSDFLSVLDGLERADGLPGIFSSASVDSTLLRKCVILKSKGGQFPDMSSAIAYFRNAFDAGVSKKKGIIELKPGVDEVFDGMKVRGSGVAQRAAKKFSYTLRATRRVATRYIRWRVLDDDIV